MTEAAWSSKVVANRSGDHFYSGRAQGRSNHRNFSKVISSQVATSRAMADIDKSREYLRYAAANERRAACAHDEGLKTMFLRVAAQYRELAQINDPAGEVAGHTERPRQFTAIKARPGQTGI
jgi:hypothetical protein